MDMSEIDKLPVVERFNRRVILKVSEIIKVDDHPNGSLLYILTLNVGNGEERQIVSSIQPFYTKEELLHKKIVLVYNLKPANFRGIRSNGMLLAASDPSVTDKETCEVIFAPHFEMPLYTKDGFVEIEGKKIGADGKYLTVEKYLNGEVG